VDALDPIREDIAELFLALKKLSEKLERFVVEQGQTNDDIYSKIKELHSLIENFYATKLEVKAVKDQFKQHINSLDKRTTSVETELSNTQSSLKELE
jgi:methyl-accepting chemotaxis protein